MVFANLRCLSIRLISLWTLALFLLSGCVSDEGMTPLLLAAESGNTQEVNEIIKSGANVNATSQYGWTALMFAAWKGHEQIVEMLLDAGADPNIVSKSVPSQFETVGGHPPSTALAEAVSENHTSIANILIDRGALIDPLSIAHAGGQGNIPLLKKFLKKGANLNQPSNRDFNTSPLCRACRAGKMDTIKWLINNGANPNLFTNGWTPLLHAIRGDHPEVVSYLLDHGADPNIVYGGLQYGCPQETALFSAVTKHTYRSRYERNYKIIEILLAHGADKSYRSAKRGTALEFIKILRGNTTKHIKPKMDPEIRNRHQKSLEHKDAVIKLLEQ